MKANHNPVLWMEAYTLLRLTVPRMERRDALLSMSGVLAPGRVLLSHFADPKKLPRSKFLSNSSSIANRWAGNRTSKMGRRPVA